MAARSGLEGATSDWSSPSSSSIPGAASSPPGALHRAPRLRHRVPAHARRVADVRRILPSSVDRRHADRQEGESPARGRHHEHETDGTARLATTQPDPEIGIRPSGVGGRRTWEMPGTALGLGVGGAVVGLFVRLVERLTGDIATRLDACAGEWSGPMGVARSPQPSSPSPAPDSPSASPGRPPPSSSPGSGDSSR